MAIRWIFFIFLVCFNAQSQSLSLEQRAIRTGAEALRWLNILHQSATKCGKAEFLEQASRAELAGMIQARFDVSLAEFETIAAQNPSFQSIIDLEVGRIDCTEQLDVVLNDFFEEYDLAKFNLEIYDPLESPITNNRPPVPDSEIDAIDIVALSKQAESIVVADLIHRDDAPPHFADIVQAGGYSQQYIVQVRAGWKLSVKLQFLVLSPTLLNQVSSKDLEHEMDEHGKIELLIFMNDPSYAFSADDVVALINLNDQPQKFDHWGKFDWEWVGKRLLE